MNADATLLSQSAFCCWMLDSFEIDRVEVEHPMANSHIVGGGGIHVDAGFPSLRDLRGC